MKKNIKKKTIKLFNPLRIYTGDINFEKNKLESHGKGVLKYLDGSETYYGKLTIFLQKDSNVITVKYGNGSGILRKKNHIYIGEFFNNCYHGHGTLVINNIRYEGFFKNNKKHGEGEEIDHKNDLYYFGKFKNGEIINKENVIFYKKNMIISWLKSIKCQRYYMYFYNKGIINFNDLIKIEKIEDLKDIGIKYKRIIFENIIKKKKEMSGYMYNNKREKTNQEIRSMKYHFFIEDKKFFSERNQKKVRNLFLSFEIIKKILSFYSLTLNEKHNLFDLFGKRKKEIHTKILFQNIVVREFSIFNIFPNKIIKGIKYLDVSLIKETKKLAKKIFYFQYVENLIIRINNSLLLEKLLFLKKLKIARIKNLSLYPNLRNRNFLSKFFNLKSLREIYICEPNSQRQNNSLGKLLDFEIFYSKNNLEILEFYKVEIPVVFLKQICKNTEKLKKLVLYECNLSVDHIQLIQKKSKWKNNFYLDLRNNFLPLKITKNFLKYKPNYKIIIKDTKDFEENQDKRGRNYYDGKTFDLAWSDEEDSDGY